MLTAAVFLSGTAQANVVDKEFGVEQKLTMTKKTVASKAVASELGLFKVESSLTSVPSSIASATGLVANKGEMAIVAKADDSASDIVGKGSVVRNTLTNELTTLTGNITVLLNNNASASQVAAASGMEVVSTFPGTDIVILKAVEGQDLVEAFDALRESGLTVESRVEVTETMYKAR